MPRKKLGNGVTNDWKETGSFIRKPAAGWPHPDNVLDRGVAFRVKYVGCVKILKSMRTVPNEDRGTIVREAMAKCCDEGGIIPGRRRKIPGSAKGILGDSFNGYCGEDVELNISKTRILVTSITSGIEMSFHDVTAISFASAGEKDYSKIIAYVSKDVSFERACFVFECQQEDVQRVINTIGQAFELKFKEFLNTPTQIAAVPQKFENSVFSASEEETTSNAYASLSSAAAATADAVYASHYNVPRASNIDTPVPDNSSMTGDGYSKLQHQQLHLPKQTLPQYNRLGQPIFGDASNQANVMFAAGDHYSDPDAGFAAYAAVYDNPIASPTARNESSGTVIYDNPTDLITNSDSVASHGSNNWVKFDQNGVGEQKDKEGYLVPAEAMHDDDDDDASEYQPVPTRSEYQKANPLAAEKWFHGKIKREDAEHLISTDGDFLVRESSSTKGQYVLTGMQDGQCRHLLLVDPEGKVRTKDRVFKDVPELIAFHLENNVPIISGGSSVFLKQEVARASNRAGSFKI